MPHPENQKLRNRAIKGMGVVERKVNFRTNRESAVHFLQMVNEFLVTDDPEIADVYGEIDRALTRLANAVRGDVDNTFLREVLIEEVMKMQTLFNDQKNH
jgi:hypothetical protein